MSKGPKGPRNPMGWGNDDPHAVKRAGESAASRLPAMHGSKAERKLMSGRGALIKWSAEKVPVTGDKPGKCKRRP